MKNNKYDKLKEYLNESGKQGICLAFSGGVDSALLLILCKNLNLTAVTFQSVFQAEEDIEFAKNFCKKYGVKHQIINYNPLEDSIIASNPKDRCYHCKKQIFSKLKEFAVKNSLGNIFDGTNYDDLNVYRPGLKALDELHIISPFALHKITKEEIRTYLKQYEPEIYDKPSNPCYATRFPYNTLLNEKSLNIVKQAEKYLKTLGFSENRVRLHQNIARIEIPCKDFKKFIKLKDKIIIQLKQMGFTYITLDIEGLRQGSMDI